MNSAELKLYRTLLFATLLIGGVVFFWGLGDIALMSYNEARRAIPIGTMFAAIFVAAVFVGADSMSRATGISNYLADLTVALALLCVLVGGFFLRFRVQLERGLPQPQPGE